MLMSDTYESLREAVFERYEDKTAWLKLSQKHNVDCSLLRRTYKSWILGAGESQPQSVRDVHFNMKKLGRPHTLRDSEEQLLVEAVKYFAANNTPLSKTGLQDLFQHMIEMLPLSRQAAIEFKQNRPSDSWLRSFLERHTLASKSVRIIDDHRVQAVTREHIAEQISRLTAAMKRYHIRDSRFIFNMDQSGASFEKMTGRSLRKGIGPRHIALIHSSVRTKGNLDRVTIMPVVSASGQVFSPVIVFPGKQAHFRKVRGQIQTLHSFLPPCYLYQREIPGVDKNIIYYWAQKFIAETVLLRRKSQKLLLLIDGYGSHVQFKTPQLFRDNGIVVIAMPSHTSHVLQPLDVSVFSAYKSYLQKEIHRTAVFKKVLDAFDIADCIKTAYTASVTLPNVVAGFRTTGVRNPDTLSPCVEPLLRLFNGDDEDYDKENITVLDLVKSFNKKSRSLLRDADVEEGGTIKVCTKTGTHLTSDAILQALQKREDRKNRRVRNEEELQLARDYKEPAADIRHLLTLVAEREERRKALKLSRRERRLNQIGSVRDRLFYEYGDHAGPYLVLTETEISD